jgi:hypothetical protein
MSGAWSIPWNVLPFLAVSAVIWGVIAWVHRRDRRRWDLYEQRRDLEQQIYEETLPEEQRAWRQQFRAQQAAITREARRRLGLPEEDETP